MNPAIVVNVLQMILAAEPAVVQAIHNLLSGNGTADDLTVLKADTIAWQAVADKAEAQIQAAKVARPPIVPVAGA